jgi:hypothetical protein
MTTCLLALLPSQKFQPTAVPLLTTLTSLISCRFHLRRRYPRPLTSRYSPSAQSPRPGTSLKCDTDVSTAWPVRPQRPPSPHLYVVAPSTSSPSMRSSSILPVSTGGKMRAQYQARRSSTGESRGSNVWMEGWGTRRSGASSGLASVIKEESGSERARQVFGEASGVVRYSRNAGDDWDGRASGDLESAHSSTTAEYLLSTSSIDENDLFFRPWDRLSGELLLTAHSRAPFLNFLTTLQNRMTQPTHCTKGTQLSPGYHHRDGRSKGCRLCPSPPRATPDGFRGNGGSQRNL